MVPTWKFVTFRGSRSSCDVSWRSFVVSYVCFLSVLSRVVLQCCACDCMCASVCSLHVLYHVHSHMCALVCIVDMRA